MEFDVFGEHRSPGQYLRHSGNVHAGVRIYAGDTRHKAVKIMGS